MKKILFSMMALLASASMSMAQNALSVEDITLPQNSTATLTVNFQLDAEDTYTGYSFNLVLPEDLEFVMAEGTNVAYTLGDCHDKSHSVTANLSDGMVKVAGLSLGSQPLTGTSGVLLTFTIKPAKTLTVGTNFTGTIKDILIVPVEGAKQNLAEGTFTITIGEPVDTRTVLDENATTAPAAATGVDVRVKRTINANEWTTICLPFAMTDAQVGEVFGNGVTLAKFTGWNATDFDANENTTEISLNFGSTNSIEANTPYLLLSENNVTEFTVDGVDINPEEEPSITVGKMNRGTFGSVTGSYAVTTVDEECLMLENGKFLYSDGTALMEGYRAYFYLQDTLAGYDAAKGANIKIIIDGTPTGINGTLRGVAGNDSVYNLAGQRIAAPQKGINIVGGKKVVVK